MQTQMQMQPSKWIVDPTTSNSLASNCDRGRQARCNLLSMFNSSIDPLCSRILKQQTATNEKFLSSVCSLHLVFECLHDVTV